MSQDICGKYVVVFAKLFNSDFTEVTNDYTKLLVDKNITIIDKSLFGFSGGGLVMQENYSTEPWAIVGMIDPSTRGEFLNIPFTSNAHMIFNANNWVGLQSILLYYLN